ncbi:glycerophosphodiester phosphodiesterase family protein [Robiginitalea sp. M366]|uniref:glycerophosphodiester phosphodiesterase n=1 Tax=Robiginitalea aestuariiviva TaxID=3036903 RepID=UPI00240E6AAA|nr:glycerophosphodiester phosphodiesterase family protein [Robiginitalea aestuariiviva]MDG1571827.1 glycerophosphodiester phosphodiesterase family protein [Robiginitalea aestuariiviva]
MKSLSLFAVCLVMVGCQPAHNTIIIGHRGAKGYVTENTVASVAHALDLGVDMIEIDVFRLRSGEIVVFHDDEVDRLTNGSGPVEEYTYEGLQQLSLEGGHTIPSLQQVLDAMAHRVPLNIELKGPGTAAPVYDITREYISRQGWAPEQFIISSFNWDELRAYRRQDPEARIAVLTEGDPLEALEVAAELNAEAVNPSARAVTPDAVTRLHKAGYKVYVWTVNDPDVFRDLRAMGVDGIFSDYPDRMR